MDLAWSLIVVQIASDLVFGCIRRIALNAISTSTVPIEVRLYFVPGVANCEKVLMEI